MTDTVRKVRRYISKGYEIPIGPNKFTVLNADCGCGSDEHRQEIMLSVESDKEQPGFVYVDVSIEAKMQCVLDRFNENWLQNLWRRVKFSVQALVGGRLDPYVYSTFSFTSREQLNDYIQTLQEELEAFDKYVMEVNAKKEHKNGDN